MVVIFNQEVITVSRVNRHDSLVGLFGVSFPLCRIPCVEYYLWTLFWSIETEIDKGGVKSANFDVSCMINQPSVEILQI